MQELHAQTARFVAAVAMVLPPLMEEEMQYLIDNPEELKLRLQVLRTPNIALGKAYALLGMKAEYEEAIAGFDFTEDPSLWKLLMVKGLTHGKLVHGYQEAGITLETYGVDLGGEAIAKDREQRDPNRDGTYLVTFRRRVEADHENKNQKASDRQEQGCQDGTLMERLLLGLAYFLATGRHLDVKNLTQCQGSRDSYGSVPEVLFGSDYRGVYVRWRSPGCRYDFLRARSVVSMSAKVSEA